MHVDSGNQLLSTWAKENSSSYVEKGDKLRISGKGDDSCTLLGQRDNLHLCILYKENTLHIRG